MIAFYGYDGFLYSIGFLAGWIVALLVIAEPLKRLGKFTFADALDSQFNSRGIKLAAAISTLVEIGRASCRERVEIEGCAVAIKQEKTEDTQERRHNICEAT